MSWQAYVDTSLVGTGDVDKAAIFDVGGTSVWAASSGWRIEPQEMKEIVAAYNDNSTPKKVYGTGFHIAREKYLVLKADERSLYGKKGKEGVIIVKTRQALLIAHYPDTVQPGVAANTVEKLADYLTQMGY